MGDDRRIRDVDDDARADGVTPAVQQMLDAMLGSHQVLESVPSIISVKDREHRILYMNHVVPGHDVSDAGWNHRAVVRRARGSRSLRGGLRARVDDRRKPRADVPDRGRPVHRDDVRPSQAGIARGLHDGLQPRCHGAPAGRSCAAARASAACVTRSRPAAWAPGRSGDGVITWDDALCQIFGVRPEEAPTRVPEFLAMVHPEDREVVGRIVARHRETGVYDDFEHRLVRPNGEVRQVISRGTPIHDENGNADRLPGRRLRHHCAQATGGAAAPGAEDGGGGAADRRRCAQLQQRAQRDHPQRRALPRRRRRADHRAARGDRVRGPARGGDGAPADDLRARR